MPIETKTRQREPTSLGKGSGEQHVSKVEHLRSGGPVPGREKTSFEVDRLFSGSGLSCLNLDLKVPDLNTVIAYLAEHTGLSGIIRRSYQELRKLFDGDIRLEPYPDPEGERSLELALIVETTDEPAVALDKLDQFDDRFWIDQMDEAADHLSVHVEYQ